MQSFGSRTCFLSDLSGWVCAVRFVSMATHNLEEILAMVSPDFLKEPEEHWMLLLTSKRFRVLVRQSIWFRHLWMRHAERELQREAAQRQPAPFLPRQRSWSSVDTETSGKS